MKENKSRDLIPTKEDLEDIKEISEILDEDLSEPYDKEPKQVPYNELRKHLDDDDYFEIIEFAFMDEL